MGNFADPTQFLKYLPPIIVNLSHSPETPAADEPVAVSADIRRISFGDDYEYIKTVTLRYSTDLGETWSDIDMDQTDESSAWTAEIPALPSGSEVLYYIRAVDSVGNSANVMPPEVSMADKWFTMSDEEAETALPHDYLVPMFQHENKSGEEIPSDLNILDGSFGYDDDKYYFRFGFETKPQAGTVSPIDANIYVFILINRDLALSPEIMDEAKKFSKSGQMDPGFLDRHRDEILDLISSVWIWYYAPIADIAPPLPDIGKIPGITLAHIDKEKSGCPIKSGISIESMKTRALSCVAFEKKGWKYKINGNNMDLSLDRKVLGDSENDSINFVALNLHIVGSDILSIQIKPGDVSYSTGIVMKTNSYVVAE